MKKYEVIKISEMWSTNNLRKNVENLQNLKTSEGYEIVAVSFGMNLWYLPTAFITICK